MKMIQRNQLLRGLACDERCFVIGLVSVGLAIRLLAVAFTYGTEDVNSWKVVGETLLQGQNPYVETRFLRWPPLWMMVIFAAKHAAIFFQLDFAKLIKIFPVLADVAIPVVIYYYFVNKRRSIDKGRLYAALYAVNPISILVVAVHGQFDSITVLFLLLSLYFMPVDGEESNYTVAAIMLGLAIFSKTWPLWLLPLYIAHVPGRKAKAVFVSVALLPLLISVSTLFVLAPTHIYHKLVRYAGIPGWWGFTSLYSVLPHVVTRYIFDLYNAIGGYVLVLGVGVMSVFYFRLRQDRRPDLVEALIAGVLLIYVFAPGYGTQYMAWGVPLLMIYSGQSKLARYFLILVSLELIVEYVFRPYNGTLGEWVLRSPELRSERFYSSYGSGNDLVITNLLRWPLWLYCCSFLAVILARWRRFATGVELRPVWPSTG